MTPWIGFAEIIWYSFSRRPITRRLCRIWHRGECTRLPQIQREVTVHTVHTHTILAMNSLCFESVNCGLLFRFCFPGFNFRLPVCSNQGCLQCGGLWRNGNTWDGMGMRKGREHAGCRPLPRNFARNRVLCSYQFGPMKVSIMKGSYRSRLEAVRQAQEYEVEQY